MLNGLGLHVGLAVVAGSDVVRDREFLCSAAQVSCRQLQLFNFFYFEWPVKDEVLCFCQLVY